MRGALLVASALAIAAPAAAEPRLVAARTSAAPKIDGRLDDEVWALASPSEPLRQRFPEEGAPATENTIVRILYDDRAVYIGARMEDRQPDKIVARLARRDRPVESDYVALAIDSRHDHATAYGFFVTAAGQQLDLLLYDDIEVSTEWDAVWDSAVSRDAGGWSAELRIPLSALRFSDAPVQEWGLQIERYLSRRKEKDRWSYSPAENSAEVSILGHLVGLTDLRPRRTLELRPFVVGKLTATSPSGGLILGAGADGDVDYDLGGSLGLDAKIGLTSNLVLDATLNPDFGQVEADEIILNLSREEIFFPEKRPFFLEGADLYATPYTTFYTRRIGAGDARIYGALKLTGKLGERLSLAALAAVTGPETIGEGDEEITLEPHRVQAVARLRWALRGATAIGLMATAALRAAGHAFLATDDHDAFTQAVDLAWRSDDARWAARAHFVTSEIVDGAAYADADGRRCADPSGCARVARDDGTPVDTGAVGYAAHLAGVYEGRSFVAEALARAISPQLNLNDLGYQFFANRYRLDGGAWWRRIDPLGAMQSVKAGVKTENAVSFDGTPEELFIQAEAELVLTNFWSFELEPWIDLPGAWERYETGDGLVLQKPGSLGLDVAILSDPRRDLTGSFNAGVEVGTNDDHWNADASLTLRYTPIPTLELELIPSAHAFGDVRRVWFPQPCVALASGLPCTIDTDQRFYRFGDLDYASLSTTLRAAYTFSPRLSLQAYGQLFVARGEFTRYFSTRTQGEMPRVKLAELEREHDFTPDADDAFREAQLNLNLVLRWEYRPGAALLAVYTRSAPDGLRTGPVEDVILVKLSGYWGI